MLEDLRAFGYPPAEIQKASDDLMAQRRAPDTFQVHPHNAFAVRLFLAMQTQWSTLALSTMSAARLVRLGLKYEVLEIAARLAGLGEISADDFIRIRLMENDALEAWAEAAA
ncbi:DUF1799 domain-containing protein [Caulobacter sp. BP25]|uniref:DUF1799 domain-containing protein n=1 Tax=Caulobacter sp. BP25 TaxID=2048900 RepID=UPI001374734B|nr:DUF1799 domain-containing protein [Caulobacter sp. BP25]